MSDYLQGRAVHVDQHLSNVALNYRPAGFIASSVLPTVLVPKQSDTYVIFEQDDLFRQERTLRARGGEANKTHTRVSSAGFYCVNYALKSDVTLEDRANADPLFVRQFEEGRVMRLQDGLFLDWETRLADLLTTPSNVGSFKAVGSSWTDHVNADPLTDLLTAVDNVETATGFRPNRVLFSGTAWRHFRRSTKVVNRAVNPHVSGGGGYPSVSQAEDLLEMKVLVGNAWRNTAQEGLPINLKQIWGDHVVVYYAPDQPSMETPSFGYNFRWSSSEVPNMQVERHPYDPRRKCTEVEIGYYQDEVITAKPLGFLVSNVTSSTL
ncbi:MAG: major capsid protein [Deltaproteobacteria bacterium]|nr:major capsid protein [Deltaproteobacteria bacterium]